MSISAATWLQRIHELPLPRVLRIMNVCGGHERSITMAGLRKLLPARVELIPGPGCPVCVCPEEDVYQAIQLALENQVILVAFGDMLRVPANLPKTAVRSLDAARAVGADVRAIASPMEAVQIAREHPTRPVVFFAAGFETTMAPVAAMLVAGVPENLSLLLSGRLTWPAVAKLLESGKPGFDALIAPGHVATVMGSHEWQFVPRQYRLPAAIAGFSTESLLAAIYSTMRQWLSGEVFLDNCYPEVVQPDGNRQAQALLQQAFQVVDANWRGIGSILRSGFQLQPQYAGHDARELFPDHADPLRRRAGSMPAGCACAQVVMGQLYPNQCPLYGRGCDPQSPIGPCMVSDEGACRIWWSSGLRQSRVPAVTE